VRLMHKPSILWMLLYEAQVMIIITVCHHVSLCVHPYTVPATAQQNAK
jgi:hypothetical protein